MRNCQSSVSAATTTERPTPPRSGLRTGARAPACRSRKIYRNRRQGRRGLPARERRSCGPTRNESSGKPILRRLRPFPGLVSRRCISSVASRTSTAFSPPMARIRRRSRNCARKASRSRLCRAEPPRRHTTRGGKLNQMAKVKKIINAPDTIVSEVLDGIVLASNGGLVREGDAPVLRRAVKTPGKVGLVMAAARDISPCTSALVGPGLADASRSREDLRSAFARSDCDRGPRRRRGERRHVRVRQVMPATCSISMSPRKSSPRKALPAARCWSRTMRLSASCPIAAASPRRLPGQSGGLCLRDVAHPRKGERQALVSAPGRAAQASYAWRRGSAGIAAPYRRPDLRDRRRRDRGRHGHAWRARGQAAETAAG